MKTIKFPSLTWFNGRNGMGKCSGINIMEDGNNGILLVPLTSRGLEANCDIVIHKAAIPEFIAALTRLLA